MYHNKSHIQRLYFLLFIATLWQTACVSSKFRIEKKTLSNHFENNAVFRESHSGLLVVDIDENKVLFDHNSHKHFTPASNTKLLTYFATIKMGADSLPSLEYCISNDTVYFSGTGDPTLLHPNFEYGKTFDFFSEHKAPLVYIPKSNDDDRFGPGWSWDDYPYSFSAEKSSFPIYGNMVNFHKNQTDNYPKVTPDYFEKNLTVSQDSVVGEVTINRKECRNEFHLKFNGEPIEIKDEIPFIYSDSLFMRLLADTLKQPIFLANQFPSCKTKYFFSVPTDSVSKHILIESDNFLAEQMLLMISHQLGDTLSSEKTIKFMMENYLSALEDEIYWVDGSGLSRYNLVTPNAMINVLRSIYTAIPKVKLYDLLPVSGVNGTLENTLTSHKGKIYAKTGSMSHVYNLSGFIETNSGKTLLFSFMNNNFNVSSGELKSEMEKVLSVFIND